MLEKAYYLYGIVKSDADPKQIAGLDGNGEVFAVPYSEIAAIVSQVSLNEFGEVPLKKNLESLDWVRDRVFGHERVIEEIMNKTTIIPMKFCTIFTTTEKILELLNEKYNYFMDLLKEYMDKYEWGVKVYCRKKETIKTVTPVTGREYLMAKKAQEKKDLEDERNINTYVEEIFRKIRPLAEEVRINRPTPKELLTDKDKEQILNISLLIPEENVKKLTVLTDDVAKLYAKEDLTIELAGPLPIYSFVPSEIK